MIYLDYASTCPPSEAVIQEFARVSQASFGNASSKHVVGREASRVLESARASVLDSLRVKLTHRCLFLSGATEANNLAIKGVALAYQNRGKRIITTQVEHPSVLNAFRQLGDKFGFEVVFLPVQENGSVDPAALQKEMSKDVILVSIMAVNNETGAINDLDALSAIVHSFPKAFFHSDVTQGIGKIKIPYEKLDLISFSGHKIAALKGTGCLVMKKTIEPLPFSSGGDQEYGIRSGTVDVGGAHSLAFALKQVTANQAENSKKTSLLRDYLWEKLSEFDEISFNSVKNGSPYVVNFSLRRHKASVIVEGLSERGICVSSISACSSKGEPISYVLEAMGKSHDDAANSIRVSPAPWTSKEEIDALIDALRVLFKEVRPR